MEFRRLSTVQHPFFQQAFDLYKISFPEHEQRLFKQQEEALSNPSYHCNIIIENDVFIGILFYWKVGQYVYVEHFAIDTDKRGNHMGSHILNEFCNQENLIILEIDPPVDVVSLRRKNFYTRLGFKENNYKHMHPAYRKYYPPHPLVVMSFPRTITQKEYNEFYSYLEKEIMQYTEK